MGDIATAIRMITNTHLTDKVRMFDAEVNDVSMTDRTCEVTMIGGKSANTLTVRLMASSDDGLLMKPTIGSTIVVMMSEYTAPFVAKYSGVDSITMLGGDLKGLVKVDDLVTQLNNLEDFVKDLAQKYNAHTHPYMNVTTPATTSPVLPQDQEIGVITNTQASDLENTNITQG
jgi:hypothetical protein